MAVLKPMDVLGALKGVRDPAADRDIVALGYVRDLEIRADRVRFVLHASGSDAERQALADAARAAVAGLPGAPTVEIGIEGEVAARPGADSGLLSGVKNIVAIASGKGGVGKSTVSANVALALARDGARVGLLDADMYGPSMPTMFAVDAPLRATPDNRIIPLEAHGIQLMSIGFMAGEGLPVIWRGPMVSNMIVQMISQVAWPELDYLVIDLPPGTGDTQLTLCQQAPLSGAAIVTTPQEISLIDAHRGLEMFRKLNIPVLGVIENMSGLHVGGEVIPVFGQGGGERIAKELELPFLGQVPLDPAVCTAADEGEPIVQRDPESPASKAFVAIARALAAQCAQVNADAAGDGGAMSLDW